MNTLEKIKSNIAKEINKALGKNLVQASDLIYPPNAKLGNLSLPCFEIVKKLKKNPKEIAKELEKELNLELSSGYPELSSAKAIGPYLNFTINKEYLTKEVLSEIDKQKNKYGQNKNLKEKIVMVEYAHPNPFKAFHIGHLRGTILGETICKLLEAQGAKISRVNYQGDVGMHIAKCLWAFQKIDPKNYPKESADKVALIGKCYSQGAAAFEKDEKAKKEIAEINKLIYSQKDKEINKLWKLGKKWSLENFQEIFKRLGARFEYEYMESEVMDAGVKYTKKALTKKILEKSQGAIIFNGKKYGLDTRVFLNSEGLPTYEGKELGLAYREAGDFGRIDLFIHNVAVEQISFFKVIFKVLELLDPEKFKNKKYHNAYEFVGLKKGKMSSRKGEVVLGSDILDEARQRIAKIIKEKGFTENVKNLDEKIGVGAIKYSFLKISPFKYLAFDMEESINFSGDSGPYLQYTYARIQSILRKSGIKDTKCPIGHLVSLVSEKEHNLIMRLAKYPETVEKAGQNYDPSEVAKYLFDLAKEFNDYYHHVPILKAEEKIREARLTLINSVAQILKNGLELLGIETVEKM